MDNIADDLDGFEPVARIVVIGIGGAGNNAVNRMIDDEIRNVEFYVLNTDKQALATSKASNRIVLGEEVTKGLGAGGDPEVGKAAAEASRDKIAAIVSGADMVFIAAGMGGGTGTGAAPIVAEVAKEAGCLVVAIVTRPFALEGKTRNSNSVRGLNALKDVVDSIIIVSNDKLLQTSGNAPAGQAFSEADRVLSTSVHTVTDLVLLPSYINRDFADVKKTLQNSGIALIGYGSASGPNRAVEAAQNAINCPLLEASISGARRAIVSITIGSNVKLIEFQDCMDEITRATVERLGYQNLCLSENQTADRARFKDIYEQIAERKKWESHLPDALKIAIKNAQAGKAIEQAADKMRLEGGV